MKYLIYKCFLAFATLLVWFSLILQFILSLTSLDNNFGKTLAVFFSYFTVLSNLIVAICLTTLLLSSKSRLGKFFSFASTQTAITIYILVVGLIYNTILRGLVEVKGIHRVADELLHVANPILFLCFWLFFTDKVHLRYRNTMWWMIYPLVYVIFIVARGALINQYPYPFINVTTLGYAKAILNAMIIMIIFWGLSLLFVFVAKKIAGTKEYTRR